MTKEFKIGENIFNYKGLKAEISLLEEKISKITQIKSYVLERSGIIGGEIRETVYYVMMGQHDLRLPEEFEEKKNQLFSLYHGTTIEKKDLLVLFERIKSLFDAHVHISDQTKTPEQSQKETAERNKRFEEAKVKKEKENAERQLVIEQLKKEYPYLIMKPSQFSDRILATKNIRIELERKFPGHKFSITSETFSMGDSIDIRWENGAVYDDVNKITKKYQEGHFDGMSDMYEYSNKAFCSLFGGAKYVSASRKVEKDKYIEVAETLGYKVHYDNYELVIDEPKTEDQSHHIQRIKELTNETSFYKKPEIPSTSGNIPRAGNEILNVSYNPEKDGIEVKFPSKPSEETLQTLKDNGFRWGKFNKVWYIKASRIPGNPENKCIYVNNLILGNQDQEITGKEVNQEEGLETQSYQSFERELQAEARSEFIS